MFKAFLLHTATIVLNLEIHVNIMAVGKVPPWIIVMVICFAYSATSEHRNSIDKETYALLEKRLLNNLGFEKKPKANKDTTKIPPHMFRLYDIRMNQNDAHAENEIISNDVTDHLDHADDIFANTVRSFEHQESEEKQESNGRYTMILQFNISKIPENEIIRAIELRISHIASANYPYKISADRTKKKITKADIKYLQRLRVYDIIRPSVNRNGGIYRLLDTNVVDTRTNGTVQFDVAPAVKRWFDNFKTNFGFLLEVIPLKKEILVHKAESHLRLKRDVNIEPEGEMPILLVHSDDPPKPREKREIHPKKYHECQRHRLYVDFKRVEWNTWIVAPIGYEAFFCHGECRFPLAEHMNSTNHAVVQTLVHSKYPSRVPPACCVPTTHTAMSMLYVDDDKRVVLKTYQEMVVEACGCL